MGLHIQETTERTDNWEGFFSHNHTDQARSVKALKKRESKFWLPPLEEGNGSEKLKKGGERMVQG